MNILDLIQSKFETYTASEKTIAVYILNNPRNFARTSIEVTVERTKTSKAGLIRFAKKLGYSGYVEFKYDFSSFLLTAPIVDNEKQTSILSRVINQYTATAQQIISFVDDEQINQCSELILNAPKIKTFAFNRTAISADFLAKRAIKIGIDIECIEDSIYMEDKITFPNNNSDLYIIITTCDNTRSIKRFVEMLHASNHHCILLAMSDLPYAKLVDVFIKLPNPNTRYGHFIDEQPIFAMFIEALIANIAANKIKFNDQK